MLNACLGGHKLADAAAMVADLAERIPAEERANANAVFSVLLASLVERNEEKIVFGGAANLAAHDFSKGLREVLEALEEQVVLMRLLGEATEPAHPDRQDRRGEPGRGPADHVGGVHGLREPATSRWPSSACSGRPGWTTRARWARCARWHVTSARS